MHASSNFGRLAGAAAMMALTAGGFAALATPAEAATGPVATLQSGTVTITGTAVRDVIAITINTDRLTVDFGANGTIDATFERSRFQRVQVLADSGDDGVSVLGAGAVPVTVSGGLGSDGIGVVGSIGQTGVGDTATTISGDDGNDTLFAATPGPVTIQAGAGDDIVNGGGAGVGQENISLGDGDDLFRSSLNAFIGVRSDIVDGGAGQDKLAMEGTFASESLSLSAAAGHLIVVHELRDRIDADNVEDVSYLGLGGLDESGDAVAVNDLTGTDVTRFTPNFSSSQNGTAPNNSADALTVRGTAGVDHITLSGSGANITVAGLKPTVNPVFLQPQDTLRIETRAGRDTVDTSGLRPGLVQLQVL
jgi:hypothetical protein